MAVANGDVKEMLGKTEILVSVCCFFPPQSLGRITQVRAKQSAQRGGRKNSLAKGSSLQPAI